jgi:hypothetical protein
VPKHAYRDSALLYGALAIIVVLVVWGTGGDVARAVFFAAGAFVVATAWSWRSFRNRLRQEAREEREHPVEPPV